MTKALVEFVDQIIFNQEVIVVPNTLRHKDFNAKIVVVGKQVRGLKLVDEDVVEILLSFLDERFTPEELTELLNITNDEIFDRFRDKILEHNWKEYF